MAKITPEHVKKALSAVRDPHTEYPIIDAGLVTGLVVKTSHVGFIIEAPSDRVAAYAPVRQAAEDAVAALPGVEKVTVVLTAHGGRAMAGGAMPEGTQDQDQDQAHNHQTAPAQNPTPPTRRHALRAGRAKLSDAAAAQTIAPSHASSGRADAPPGSNANAQANAQANPRANPRANRAAKRLSLPGISHIIAVASGKGGVGKSTVAANLACALAASGHRTGLLDADIYGPSTPILMDLVGADPAVSDHQKLIPPVAFGVKVMSIGFMVDDTAPMIWRGPIVMSAITQMLKDVDWGDLDVLVVDMPPGTGDAQLTLVQRVALAGAVIVSTPQQLALADVRRGVEMFRRTQTPVLGIVENMSATVDPATGTRFAPFGEGGAKQAAHTLDTPFLTAIGLNPNLAAASDTGRPPAACAPSSLVAKQFFDLADTVSKNLAHSRLPPEPVIIVE